MDTIRQIGGSLLLAMFSVALVLGGISLALAESYVPQIPTPTQILPPTSIFGANVTSTETSTLAMVSFTPDTPSPSPTVPPPTSCPPPAGWIAVSVQPGDSLQFLASRYRVTPENLSAANCLFSSELPVGSIVYVPPVPTQTSVPCGPPPGWVRYTVQPGNTLTGLSLSFGVSVTQLQFANCMPFNQFYIATGQVIWVPNVATHTPRATATKTLTPVVIIFPTLTWTPSITPSPTKTLPPTNTPVPTATFTSSPPPTFTAIVPTIITPPTVTPSITAFPTATPPSPAPTQ
jgi:LysM repeat protein